MLYVFACSRQSSTPSPGATNLSIAVAASLKPVLPGLVAAFGKVHPTITVTPSYGASGNFYSQLTNGAPFDLFLSADDLYPQKLADAGLTTGAPRVYAAGRLVLWKANSTVLEVSDLSDVAQSAIIKVAIANPAHAPYGRAAHRALESAGVLEAVKGKLVLGESVEQAATFVRTGAAEVAILPRSLALSSPMKDEGVFIDVPAALYEPIQHGAVVLKSSAHSGVAELFVSFLLGPEAQAVLSRSGLAAAKD